MMTREKMRELQAVPKRPVLRFHSHCGGRLPTGGIVPTAPLVRVKDKYHCTRCGKEA